MDKAIEKTGGSTRRWIAIAALSLTVVLVTVAFLSRSGHSRLKVDSARLTTATVQRTEFHEYYPFDGTVAPATSVYLDVEEGGRVEEILVEGGQQVNQGDLILRLSNTAVQRTAIATETQLLENLDIQSNTQFNREQNSLLLEEALLELDHRISELDKKHRRYEALVQAGSNDLSMLAYETMRDELKYLRDRRALLAKRIRHEEMLSAKQLSQARRSIDRLNASMALLDRIVRSLDVRAPISGFLSSIEAQVGESIRPGQRIGQVDLLDRFKVRARVDQYYISRVEVGTAGQVNLDGRNWRVAVQKVYPEVRENAFVADVVFVDAAPSTLKRGQTLTVELSFGEPAQSLTVAKGGFFQETSGRWVYLLAKDGRTARRAAVRLGRQNPRQVEVLEGLREGDRIVTSGYDTFNGVDELRFSTAIENDPSNEKQRDAA